MSPPLSQMRSFTLATLFFLAPEWFPIPGSRAAEAKPQPAADKTALRHGAFQAPIRPKVPEVKNKNWVRTPIDNFILARLEKEELQPSPEADKTTWLRRLNLDLVGLPPTIQGIDSFLADESSGAYDRQVERLLHSPHYGERWGRHWLDVDRYADSDGFEKDKPRFIGAIDWVINAQFGSPARPLHHRADRRRSVAEPDPGATRGHGLSPQRHAE